MSFKLTSEQLEFQDSLRTFLAEKCDSTYLRKRTEAGKNFDPELWTNYQNLGLFEFFGSTADGMTVDVRDLALISFESGYALEPEGLAESLLGGPYLLKHLLSKGRFSEVESHLGTELVEELLGGQRKCVLAPWTAHNRISIKGHAGGKCEVSGELAYASMVESTEAMIIGASTGELVLLDPRLLGAGSCALEPLGELDGLRRLARIRLKAAPGITIDSHLATKVETIFRVLKASETAGLVQRVCSMTGDYLKTRKQFGVPIGGFQAVQHRMADMFANAEAMRTMALFASWAATNDAQQAAFAASAAFAFALEHGASIVEGGIQLHGGIGFTWEYDLHLFLRRAKSMELLYASDEVEYKRLLEMAGQSF